jgi:hypothetical protein
VSVWARGLSLALGSYRGYWLLSATTRPMAFRWEHLVKTHIYDATVYTGLRWQGLFLLFVSLYILGFVTGVALRMSSGKMFV